MSEPKVPNFPKIVQECREKNGLAIYSIFTETSRVYD